MKLKLLSIVAFTAMTLMAAGPAQAAPDQVSEGWKSTELVPEDVADIRTFHVVGKREYQLVGINPGTGRQGRAKVTVIEGGPSTLRVGFVQKAANPYPGCTVTVTDWDPEMYSVGSSRYAKGISHIDTSTGCRPYQWKHVLHVWKNNAWVAKMSATLTTVGGTVWLSHDISSACLGTTTMQYKNVTSLTMGNQKYLPCTG